MRAYDWVRRRNRESKKNWAENEKKNYGGLGLDKFRPLARVEGENKTICYITTACNVGFGMTWAKLESTEALFPGDL